MWFSWSLARSGLPVSGRVLVQALPVIQVGSADRAEDEMLFLINSLNPVRCQWNRLRS
jgi:hypothetical protein